MNELDAAISTRLGTTYSAFAIGAPSDTSYPFIVWSWQGGGLTDDHDIIDGLEWVRAYAASAVEAGTLYAYFDGTLNGGTLTVTGFSAIGLRRETFIEFSETLPTGQQIFTKGAYYRVILDE